MIRHVVRRGDSLWGLAGQYLGAGVRWPEIHKFHDEFALGGQSQYKQVLPHCTLEAKLSGTIAIENMTHGRYRHNLELALSKEVLNRRPSVLL